MPILPSFLSFALALMALLGLNRWVTYRVQMIGFRLTGDRNVGLMAYYVLMLPGIVLHELSHAFMAWLLGMRVSDFSLGPKRQGQYVELGSVTVSSGGVLRDSLVGLAPFLSGTAVILLVGYQVFDLAAVSQAWRFEGWNGVWRAARGMVTVADFWLWTYLILAVSNAMMPSPADRRPWLAVGAYLGVVLGLAYLTGSLPVLSEAGVAQVGGALRFLALGFGFTVALDFLVALSLWGVDLLVVGLQRG